MARHRQWIGKVPARDYGGEPIDDVMIDGRTVGGWWALMAPSTHEIMGCGLGVGRGQRYRKAEDGKWYRDDQGA